MDTLSVSSSLLIPSAQHIEITPAMLAVLWGVADELDDLRIDPSTRNDAVWLEVPTKRLRDPEGRNDNFWLKECLKRLTGIQLEGDYRGDEWGAVVIAEWHLLQGGSVVRLLIPPAAIRAICSPKTFAKIELTAAYRLSGHARRLYAALADKKRMGNPHWTYSLEELRIIFGTEGRYQKWYDFRRYVLLPALEEINDYGTVQVTFSPQKKGRSIIGARFDWRWKNQDEVRVTDEENQRHPSARRKPPSDGSAPPLTDGKRKQIAYQDWSKDNPGNTYGQFLDWWKEQEKRDPEQLS